MFKDAAFNDWWDEDDIRCLWIHGDPGKGKTMMAMAVIDEITDRIKESSGDTPVGYISYFFCQAAIPGLNDAISVLKGLIYVLINEHPELVSPLRRALSQEGSHLFEGDYGVHAIWEVLQHILEDEQVPRVYLVVDAIDECSGLQDKLLLLLTNHAQNLPKKVKWIITSRNEPQIKRALENSSFIHHTSLELNSDHVTQAVREFIRVKVKNLNYDDLLREEVEKYLTDNADGTFLWVALVCQELKKVVKRRVRPTLRKFPSGLEPLYGRMLEQIEDLSDPDDREDCSKVLRITVLAYRPLQLKELNFAADLPDEKFADFEDLSDLINQCGSFLIIRDEIVYFVHQSAKDFFSHLKGRRVFPTTQEDEHRLFACRLLKLMSQELKRNICNLDNSGVEDVEPAVVAKYVSGTLGYSCQYWVDHSDHGQVSLDDDGPVHQFIQNYCLYWLEVMSLIGEIPKATTMMIKLENLVDVSMITLSNRDLFDVRYSQRKLLSYNL